MPGRYLDTDYPGGVMVVQIDQVANGSARGTLTIGNMKSANAVVRWTESPITGTLHGDALNLIAGHGGGKSVLKGTVVPDGLDLTIQSNGRTVRAIFKREDNAQAGEDV